MRKPDYTLDQLLKLSPVLNAAVTGSVAASDDGEHKQFVGDGSQKEVEQGWLYPSQHGKPECIANAFPSLKPTR